MILAIRAVWDCWQNGTRLNFRGEFYRLTLMTPFFSPGPIGTPRVPIYIAGVNTSLCRLAGELADGFHVHPNHTVKYVREIVLPGIEAGLALSGRTRADLELVTSVFVITNDAEREAVRAQVAFYSSTPSYRSVLDCHGWGEVGERLSRMAARGEWAQMPAEVSDEMLDAFAVAGTYEELPAKIHARYDGLLDRIMLYMPFTPGRDQEQWRTIIEGIHG